MHLDALMEAMPTPNWDGIFAEDILAPNWGSIFAACLDLYIPKKIKTRRRSWKQCDVTRALRAAKAAGFLVRVEIEPDGRIVLVPVLTVDAKPAERAQSWDVAIDQASSKIHPRLS